MISWELWAFAAIIVVGMSLSHARREPVQRRRFIKQARYELDKVVGERPIIYQAKEFAFFIGDRDQPQTVIYLGQLFRQWRQTRWRQRASLLARHFIATRALQTTTPPVFAQAQADILVRVRSRSYYHQLKAAALQMEQTQLPLMADCDSIPPHLCVELVYDTEQAIHSIDPQRLQQWGMDSESLYQLGLQNLRLRRTNPNLWDQAAPGIYLSTWQDAYDASRLLYPDIFATLEVQGDPVAIPLSRDELYVTGSDDANSLRAVAHVVQQRVEHVRVESVRPLVLHQGVWQEFNPAPDSGAAQHVALLRVIDQYHDHAAQKAYLDALAEKQGSGIQTAKLVFFEKGQRYYSFSTWHRGTAWLLPQSDLIAFHESEDDHAILVPWDAVLACAGHLMQAQTQYQPSRVLVSGYPDAAAMAALKEKQIDSGAEVSTRV